MAGFLFPTFNPAISKITLQYTVSVQSINKIYPYLSSPQHLSSDQLHGICSADTWSGGHNIGQDRLCTLGASVHGGRSVSRGGS